MNRHTVNCLAVIGIVLLVSGCEKNSQSIVGKWVGTSPDNQKITYHFKEDNTLIWTIDSPVRPFSTNAKYSIDYTTDPVHIDIYEFSFPRLKDYSFYGIVEFTGKDTMRLFGTSSKTTGGKAKRPGEFGSDTIEFQRLDTIPSDGKQATASRPKPDFHDGEDISDKISQEELFDSISSSYYEKPVKLCPGLILIEKHLVQETPFSGFAENNKRVVFATPSRSDTVREQTLEWKGEVIFTTKRQKTFHVSPNMKSVLIADRLHAKPMIVLDLVSKKESAIPSPGGTRFQDHNYGYPFTFKGWKDDSSVVLLLFESDNGPRLLWHFDLKTGTISNQGHCLEIIRPIGAPGGWQKKDIKGEIPKDRRDQVAWITDHDISNKQISFSPDARFAAVYDRFGGSDSIVIVDLQEQSYGTIGGKSPIRIPTDSIAASYGYYDFEGWSDDSSAVFVTMYEVSEPIKDLWRINLPGGTMGRVTDPASPMNPNDMALVRETWARYATERGDKAWLEDLLNHIMVKHKKIPHGSALLHKAAEGGCLDIAELLLERGVDINAMTGIGTPLHRAANEGQVEMVSFLIDSGAGVNLRETRGITALWWAVREGHLDVVKALVEGGADVNIKGEFGKTPLDVAQRYKHEEIVTFLKQHGAKTQ